MILTFHRTGPVFGCRRGVTVTGWVGVVWSMENSLISTAHPSDHLESLLFLADHSVNWRCFDSAED
jgi:hypothetical protein